MKNGYYKDAYGTQEWWVDGKRHRDDGPAAIYSDGTQFWYLHDKLHREDGPAAIYSDGTQRWYIYSRLHREDGPAYTGKDGSLRWYVSGKCITKEVNHWFEDFNITYETMKFEDKMALKFFIRGLAT